MSFVLICHVKGNTAVNVFPVDIEKDRLVSHLKDAIKAKMAPEFDHLPADNLRLWKVAISGDIEDQLKNLSLRDSDELLSINEIGYYWPKKPPKETIHVIIELPGGILKHLSVLEETDSVKRRKIEEDYNKTVNIGEKASAPSAGAVPSVFVEDQRNNSTIFMGRPINQTGPPIVLFHDEFGRFSNDFANPDLPIKPHVYSIAQKLMATASQFFSDENSRNNAMKAELTKFFCEPIVCLSYGDNEKKVGDGVLITANGTQICYRLIFEGKNELCSTQAEATLQASLYYQGYWSQIESKKIRDRCCCPSFMLVIAGPWIGLLGGIYIDKIVVEPLTDLISLIPKPRDNNQVKYIARFLVALNMAMTRLQDYYQNLTLNNFDGPNDQRYFPSFSTYKDMDNHNIQFKYIHQLTNDFQKPLWKAMVNNHPIVIKFARRYNKKAHLICAELKLAPNLLYCGDLNVNGFIMIVMDYIDGDSLAAQNIINMPTTTRRNIMNNVQQAIDALHEKNIVFGDLRLPNILVINKKAMLVDFEWCGTHNVDRYPLSMSTEITWPDDASPGSLLMQAHDNHWLDILGRDLHLS